MTTLSLTFAAPAPVVLRAAPTLSLAFPDPQPVVLQVQGIQGGGGSGGGGATNLAWNAATRTLSSDTGTDAVLTLADGSNAGLMSSASFLALSTALQPGALIPWTDIDGRPSLFPPSAHGHVAADISDFASAARGTVLTGYAAAGSRIALAATDTILGAFGKLGKWVADLAAVAFSGSASDLTTGTLPAARFDDTAHGNRAGGTLHPAATTSVAGFMSGADKTKLDGVATGATANATDAALRDRGTHTGTQLAGTISDFNSTSRAQTEAALIAGTNVTITPAGSGATRTLTIAATGGGGSAITGLTGDVTATGPGSVAATIAPGAVTLSKMANLAASTIIGNNTGSPATPIPLTAAQVKTLLAIAAGDVSGLAAVATSGSASDLGAGTLPNARLAAFGSGDVSFAAGGGAGTIANNAVTLAKMADMATASLIYRKTAGTGDPEVNTLATLKTDLGLTGTNSGDQTITLTGDLTGSGTGSFAATIANDAVTNTKLANMATARIKGRTTAGTGDPEDLTGAQARGVLGLPAITVSTTAPGSPAVGDLWVDTNP